MATHTWPSWADHAIWWHVMPLSATGAPGTLDEDAPLLHRLGRVEGWLDHLVSLGCSGLQLGPVFRSTSHGYDTLDHRHVDPRLGDDEDLDHLLAACHARGVRVMLDGVFNHVSRDHPLFRRAELDGPHSEAASFFDFRRAQDGKCYPQVFEGNADLVTLNHRSPAVADLVVDVMCRWCARGVDAWRLDAAYAVDPAFWAEVLPRVRESFPEVLVVGEVIHGDYPALVEAATLDSLTQYELWKAIWSSVESQNLFELDWSLQRHDAFLDTFVPTTFVSNHDTTRIASRIGTAGAEVAATVLMGVGGMPVVYHGDEFAMTGVKEDRPGGDDAVRPELPADLQPLAADPAAAHMLHVHRSLIALRRRHPWLVRARAHQRALTNTHAVWEVVGEGGEALLLEVDLSDTPWALIRGGTVLFDTRW